jgi:hypothetical protein
VNPVFNHAIYNKERAMKIFIGIVGVGTIVLFSAAIASANPALLPKHPGYPAGKAVSPVNGQPLANDPGQTNLGGEKALNQSVSATDNHTQQKLNDESYNQRIKEREGAGRLPKVQGPQIRIEPPVKEATRMK